MSTDRLFDHRSPLLPCQRAGRPPVPGDQPRARLPEVVRNSGPAVRLLPSRRHLARARRSRPEFPARCQEGIWADARRQRAQVRNDLRAVSSDRSRPPHDQRGPQPARDTDLILIRQPGTTSAIPGRSCPEQSAPGPPVRVRHGALRSDCRQRHSFLYGTSAAVRQAARPRSPAGPRDRTRLAACPLAARQPVNSRKRTAARGTSRSHSNTPRSRTAAGPASRSDRATT